MGNLQEDITKLKFGRLTAVCWDHNEKHITKSGREVHENFWKFICDCGNEKVLRKSRVKPFCKTSIQSCGCLKNENKRKGYKEITGTYWCGVRKNAEKRKLEFSIVPKDAWEKYIEQGKICALTGLELVFSKKNQSASLDRIDSTKGYVKGNIQWVHRDLNTMKWNFKIDYFVELCKLVVLRFAKI